MARKRYALFSLTTGRLLIELGKYKNKDDAVEFAKLIFFQAEEMGYVEEY